MAVFAENGSFRPKNCYGRNFSYGRISAFLKLSLTVSVFRKKFPFGHTLPQSKGDFGEAFPPSVRRLLRRPTSKKFPASCPSSGRAGYVKCRVEE